MPSTTFSTRHQHLPALILLLGMLVLGLCITGDYGVAWDEGTQRIIGQTNLEYVRTGNEALMADFIDKDHGAAFELPLVVIESLAGPMTFGDMIWLRHALSFAFYLCGIWCGYLLACRLFKSQLMALTGMALLLLQPRIFAHAFFNSKDVPFMAAMLIGLYAVSVAISGKRSWQFILAGAACGYATGIRTMGALLTGLAALAFLIDSIAGKERRGKAILNLLSFGLAAAAMLYLSWPALWRHPVATLQESFTNLSRFTRWTGTVLLNGQTYNADNLPWYYAPEWFLISTPVFWLILGFAGAVSGTYALIRNKRIVLQREKAQTLVICAGLIAIPFTAVIALRSVLYDDWRHLYFIYPPFIMVALYGLERLIAMQRIRTFAALAVMIQIAVTGLWMLRSHPFQQVYFNEIVSHEPEHLRKNFDYDYWAVSFRQGLQFLLKNDPQDTIVLSKTFGPLWDNVDALPPVQRARFKAGEKGRPGSYLLTTYRLHPQDFPYRLVHGFKAGGSTLLGIYRIGP